MLQEAKEVCPTTTQGLIRDGALLVDVREPEEVQAIAFDVPNIVNIPLSQLEQRWSELPKDRQLVMVCQSGARSLKAAYYMQFHGYKKVANMSNGLEKWIRRGFPVKASETGVPSAAPVSCCGTAAPAKNNSCCSSGVTDVSSTCCGPTSTSQCC